MSEFKDIATVWKNQSAIVTSNPEELMKKAKQIKKTIKREYIWTQVILFITVVVLIFFFVTVSAYNFNQSLLGATLMVFAMLTRIILEYCSQIKLKKLDSTLTLKKYADKAALFYNRRKKVHFIYTPIVLISYAAGFILLLPYFEKALSKGFYTYIWISAIVLLFVFSFFIYKQAQKELSILKFLKSIDKE